MLQFPCPHCDVLLELTTNICVGDTISGKCNNCNHPIKLELVIDYTATNRAANDDN